MKLLYSCLLLVILITSMSLVGASDAIVAYSSASGIHGENSTKIRFWNSTANESNGLWGTEIELPTSGTRIHQVVAKYFNKSVGFQSGNTSDKIVVISHSKDGYFDAYVCRENCTDPHVWVVTNNFAKTAAPVFGNGVNPPRFFDFDIEPEDKDVVLVYAVENASEQCDLRYISQDFSASSFSDDVAAGCIDDTGHSTDINYTWVSMDADPYRFSRELLLTAYDDTNKNINAWVWKGISGWPKGNSSTAAGTWHNQTEISAAATETLSREALAVEYSTDGSKGMVIGADGTSGLVRYKYWNETAWSTGGSFDIDSSDVGDLWWTTLKANPATDDLQAVLIDNNADLGTAYWNGTAWNVTRNIDTDVDYKFLRGADFAWEKGTSKGKLVWETDWTGSTLSTRTCSPQCTGLSSNISTYVDTGSWITLWSNPNNISGDKINILGVRLNGNGRVGSFSWNESVFRNYGDEVLSSLTGNPNVESYSLGFKELGLK